MQLAAFSQNQFPLGHAAMLVNEGLVLYLVEEMKRKYPLSEMVVGLLGMAFKADCDDTRSSLSYKLKKILKLVAADVLTTDPLRRDRSGAVAGRRGGGAQRPVGPVHAAHRLSRPRSPQQADDRRVGLLADVERGRTSGGRGRLMARPRHRDPGVPRGGEYLPPLGLVCGRGPDALSRADLLRPGQ